MYLIVCILESKWTGAESLKEAQKEFFSSGGFVESLGHQL